MQMLGGFFYSWRKPRSRYLKTIKEPSLMGLWKLKNRPSLARALRTSFGQVWSKGHDFEMLIPHCYTHIIIRMPPGTCHTWWKLFNKNSNQVYILAKDLGMVNMGLCLNWVHLGSTSHMLTFSSSLFPQAFTSQVDFFNSPFHHAFSSNVWHILNLSF